MSGSWNRRSDGKLSCARLVATVGSLTFGKYNIDVVTGSSGYKLEKIIDTPLIQGFVTAIRKVEEKNR